MGPGNGACRLATGDKGHMQRVLFGMEFENNTFRCSICVQIFFENMEQCQQRHVPCTAASAVGAPSTVARSMKTAAIAKRADLLASMVIGSLDEDGKFKSTCLFISNLLKEQEVDDNASSIG